MAKYLQFIPSGGFPNVSDKDEMISLKEEPPLGGTNFLVSAVMLLKKQKKDLQSEILKLKERVQVLESQNAAFMNVSADRLLEKQV